jgi:hypothetical protein
MYRAAKTGYRSLMRVFLLILGPLWANAQKYAHVPLPTFPINQRKCLDLGLEAEL